MMRIITFTLLGFLVLVGVGIVVIPIIYRNEIEAQVSKSLQENVNAKPYFNSKEFDITMLRNFPSLTVGLGHFGVVGIGPFERDTLVQVKRFDLVLNLMSVLGGDQIKINRIALVEPKIKAIKLADGTVNWDIAKPKAEEAPKPTEEPSKFNIAIKSWEIVDGTVEYQDYAGKTNAKLVGLNHSGSGDFTQDMVDITTKTGIKQVFYTSNETKLANGQSFDAEVNLNADMKAKKYAFRENQFKLNEFTFGFDGSVQMLEAGGMQLDLSYGAKETSFKSLLSLIPAVYTESFKEIKTDGSLAFDGTVKGLMQGEKLPAYTLNLLVKNGLVQYPKLPSAVTNIQLDMMVNNLSGELPDQVVNIKNFHLDLGKNPLDAKALLAGVQPMKFEGNVKTRVDLSEVTQAFPLEDMKLRGLLQIDASGAGIYDTTRKTMPVFHVLAQLMEGYVKSDKLPAPIDNINVNVMADNSTGVINDTKVQIQNLNMVFEGETISGSAFFEKFDNLAYDVKLKGAADLGKLTKIFPQKGKTFTGLARFDLETKGTVNDAKDKNYAMLPTRGTAELSNFTYAAKDLKQTLKVSQAKMNFNPGSIDLPVFESVMGSSDVSLKGNLTDYIPYILNQGPIKGNLTMVSKQFNCNEWLSPEDPKAAEKETGTASKVVELPKNVDVTFNAKLDKVLYTNLTLEQLTGSFQLKEGVMAMQNLAFNSLGGNFKMKGSYDPRDLSKPLADFNLDINNLDIPTAYEAFPIIRQMAPVAKSMSGRVSTKLTVNTQLDKAMKPVFSTVNGSGALNTQQAGIKDFGLVKGLNNFTKMNLPSEVAVADKRVEFVITDGMVTFKPFDLNLAQNKMSIGGSLGLDGRVDYLMKTNIAAGAIGSAANSAIASLTGAAPNTSGNIKLNIKVTGTHDKPQYALVGTEGGDATSSIKAAATQQFDTKKKELEDKAKAEADRLKKEAETRAKAEVDKAKAELERQKQEAERRAREEAERLRKQAEDKAREELEKLKSRLPFK